MIIDALLSFLYIFVAGISALVSLFGDVVPNPIIGVAFSTMTSYYAAINAYLPVDTLLAILAFDIIFEASYLSYKLLKWAYSKVPGVT